MDLGEAGHAVVVGHLARGDAGPQHGGELGLQRGEIAAGAVIDQMGGSRGGAAVHQRVEQFPVSRIPADQQQAFVAAHETEADSGPSVPGSAAGVVACCWRCLR